VGCLTAEPRSLLRWRLGRLVYGRLLFATQIFVFAVRLCLKINFRHIAHQPRQSMIETPSLRSALGCCEPSTHSISTLIECGWW